MSAATKNEASPHITTESLDKLPILDANKKMTMQGIKCSRNFVAENPQSTITKTVSDRGIHAVHVYMSKSLH